MTTHARAMHSRALRAAVRTSGRRPVDAGARALGKPNSAIGGAVEQLLRTPGRPLEDAMRLALERGIGRVDAPSTPLPRAAATLPVIRADDPHEDQADRVADRFVALAALAPRSSGQTPSREGTHAPASRGLWVAMTEVNP